MSKIHYTLETKWISFNHPKKYKVINHFLTPSMVSVRIQLNQYGYTKTIHKFEEYKSMTEVIKKNDLHGYDLNENHFKEIKETVNKMLLHRSLLSEIK